MPKIAPTVREQEVTVEIIPVEKLKKAVTETKQIVQQNEVPLNNESPENPKFLGAHNQVVQKQTKAAKTGEFQNLKQSGKKKLSLENIAPKIDIAKMVDEREAHEKALQNKPQPQGADSFSAQSQTNDHLKDVEEGKETLLSTKEFVYYSFYSRIRNQLNQHWSSKVREKLVKMVRKGRYIASTDDKITKLLITLNEKGTLVRVQVLSDSGVRDLDDAAIEAFRAAAPFPNPPAGIVDQDGTVKITWDFIVEA